MTIPEDYLELILRRPDLFANAEGGIRVETERSVIAAIEAEVRRRYEADGHPPGWAEVGIRYRDPWIAVLRDAVSFPDGSVGIHSRLVRLGGEISGVVVCPRSEGRFVLIRHFRHATRRWHWEFPRGGVDGEAPGDAAVREIGEEIGARLVGLQRLGEVHGATHILANAAVLYLADVEAIGEPQRSEGIAAIRLVSADELAAMVRDGEITDSFTMAAFAQARLRGIL